MISNTELTQEPGAVAQSTLAACLTSTERNWSYSRRRRNAFDAWQEHVRRYASTVGTAFSAPPDRDLRRPIVAG